jgi:hypothetical protein
MIIKVRARTGLNVPRLGSMPPARRYIEPRLEAQGQADRKALDALLGSLQQRKQDTREPYTAAEWDAGNIMKYLIRFWELPVLGIYDPLDYDNPDKMRYGCYTNARRGYLIISQYGSTVETPYAGNEAFAGMLERYLHVAPLRLATYYRLFPALGDPKATVDDNYRSVSEIELPRPRAALLQGLDDCISVFMSRGSDLRELHPRATVLCSQMLSAIKMSKDLRWSIANSPKTLHYQIITRFSDDFVNSVMIFGMLDQATLNKLHPLEDVYKLYEPW